MTTASSTSASSASPIQGAHVPVLDGIRGLAILAVMWNHATHYGGTHAFDAWFNYLSWWGWIGVDLFFVLSGYLITGILLDSRGSSRFFGNFYARRALRIFPLYYAVVAFSFLVLPPLLPPAQAERFGRIAGDGPYYLLYLQNFVLARGGVRHGVLGVTWSLAIEEQFYFVWPSVVYFCSPRELKRLTGALFVTALVCRAVFSLGLHLAPFSIYVLTPCRMDSLAAGAYLAVRAREAGGLQALAPAARRIGFAAALAAVALVVGERLGGLVDIWTPGQGPISIIVGFRLVALAAGALLVLVVTAKPASRLHRVFASPRLRFFGIYAYGLYLVHLPICGVLAVYVFGPAYRQPPHTFPMIWGTEIFGQILFYGLALACVVPVAWLSYHLYEKHFLKLKRFFGERRQGG